jgi:hypothetical protein
VTVPRWGRGRVRFCVLRDASIGAYEDTLRGGRVTWPRSTRHDGVVNGALSISFLVGGYARAVVMTHRFLGNSVSFG